MLPPEGIAQISQKYAKDRNQRDSYHLKRTEVRNSNHEEDTHLQPNIQEGKTNTFTNEGGTAGWIK